MTQHTIDNPKWDKTYNKLKEFLIDKDRYPI